MLTGKTQTWRGVHSELRAELPSCPPFPSFPQPHLSMATALPAPDGGAAPPSPLTPSPSFSALSSGGPWFHETMGGSNGTTFKSMMVLGGSDICLPAATPTHNVILWGHFPFLGPSKTSQCCTWLRAAIRILSWTDILPVSAMRKTHTVRWSMYISIGRLYVVVTGSYAWLCIDHARKNPSPKWIAACIASRISDRISCSIRSVDPPVGQCLEVRCIH